MSLGYRRCFLLHCQRFSFLVFLNLLAKQLCKELSLFFCKESIVPYRCGGPWEFYVPGVFHSCRIFLPQKGQYECSICIVFGRFMPSMCTSTGLEVMRSIPFEPPNTVTVSTVARFIFSFFGPYSRPMNFFSTSVMHECAIVVICFIVKRKVQVSTRPIPVSRRTRRRRRTLIFSLLLS